MHMIKNKLKAAIIDAVKRLLYITAKSVHAIINKEKIIVSQKFKNVFLLLVKYNISLILRPK
ncbi:hypothetical protein SDC9_211914 [bioreactor metagenome]|uniref:Uncharacterized protein n=1 Tax=bioreactor metagenome TaxID=1076179 RepID=A0A645JYG9_9ZZZZ